MYLTIDIYYRTVRGRVTHIQGPPCSGKSTVVRMFRTCATLKGKTVRFPDGSAKFAMAHIDG